MITVKQVQKRLMALYGPDSYYSLHYARQEEGYWGHIPDWIAAWLLHCDTGRTLDIGCGWGTLSVFCSSLECGIVDALDKIPRHFTYIAPFALHITGDIERDIVPLKPPYTTVVMTEVLEHFNFHPLPTMQFIRGLMVSGGHLFLSTPDSDSAWGRCSRYPRLSAIPEYNPTNAPAWIDGHIWQYNKAELLDLLLQAGFKVLRLEYSESPGGRHFNIEAVAV